MWSIYVMFFYCQWFQKKIRGAFHRKKQYRKNPVFCWLPKKKNHGFSPIQPTHRGWHNITNTRCPQIEVIQLQCIGAWRSLLQHLWKLPSRIQVTGVFESKLYRVSRVFFFLFGGNSEGCCLMWKGGFRGTSVFIFCIWVIDSLMMRWTFKIVRIIFVKFSKYGLPFKSIIWVLSYWSHTPRKTNMSRENQWLEDTFPTEK